MKKNLLFFNYQIFGTGVDLLKKNDKENHQSIYESAYSGPHIESEIFVPFALAVGTYDVSLVFEVNTDKFKKPSEMGDTFKIKNAKGVIDFTQEIYIVDGNHSPAGNDLLF